MLPTRHILEIVLRFSYRFRRFVNTLKSNKTHSSSIDVRAIAFFHKADFGPQILQNPPSALAEKKRNGRVTEDSQTLRTRLFDK